ncbi:MAG: hypothetical protein ACFB11_21110 [Paracoccaceae bacterium]
MTTEPTEIFLELSLTGEFRAMASNGEDLTPRSSKAQAILAMVAMSPEMRRERKWLEKMLWSERNEDVAKGGLRQALSELRTSLGPCAKALKVGSDAISLEPGLIRKTYTQGETLLDDLWGSVRDPSFAAWLSGEQTAFDLSWRQQEDETSASLPEQNGQTEQVYQLPEDLPLSTSITFTAQRLSLGPGDPVPEREELAQIYEDLREAVRDLRDLGNLSNQSPLLARGIERFLGRIPPEYTDLEQVRFGIGLQALRLQFEPERSTLQDVAPDKVGHIEAVLLYSDLIAARLPEWRDFLEEEEDNEAVIEVHRETTEQILDDAAKALAKDPRHFDVSLFERIREYLDDATTTAYLASKDLLLAIAHKTFTLARELIKDTASAQRKQAIKNIATALNVQLGAVLLELAGLLPHQLKWLVAWLNYLPKLLT